MSAAPPTSSEHADAATVGAASGKKRFRCYSNYFVPGDLVWIRPAKLPYWPAEVLYSHEPSNTVRARLIGAPPAELLAPNVAQETRLQASRAARLAAKRKKLEAKLKSTAEASSDAVTTGPGAQVNDYEEAPVAADVVTSGGLNVFFFDKMITPEEIEECMEERLRRGSHDVSAYESALYRAVLQANRLARVVFSPEKLKPYTVCGVGVVHSLMRTHIAAPRQPHTGTFEPQTAVIRLRKGLENAARNLEGFEYIWVLFQFSYASAFATGEGQEGVRRLAEAQTAAQASPSPETQPPNQSTSGTPAEEADDLIGDALSNWRKRQGLTNSQGFKAMIVPPRDDQLRGVFATRSPHRPNFIGISCVRLVMVHGLDIHIADHDLLHGTPVLDIKPYLPFCDAHPDAKAGWVDELEASGRGKGDHKYTAQLTRIDRALEDPAVEP